LGRPGRRPPWDEWAELSRRVPEGQGSPVRRGNETAASRPRVQGASSVAHVLGAVVYLPDGTGWWREVPVLEPGVNLGE